MIAHEGGFNMGKRMTWAEIQEKYPEQWVALDEVIYLNNDGCNVESAMVICVMSDDEYIDKRLDFIHNGMEYVYERTEDIQSFVEVII